MDAVKILCYYPHYLGTMVTEGEIDLNLMLLLLNTAKDEKAEEKEIEENKLDLDTTATELMNGIDMHEAPAWKHKYNNAEHIALNELTKIKGKALWGFSDLIRGEPFINKPDQPSRVIRALKTKGWCVVEWEEGSIGIALPQFDNLMRRALKKIEAQHAADAMEI